MITLTDEVVELLRAGKLLLEPKVGVSFEGVFTTYAKDNFNTYYAVIDDGKAVRIIQTPNRALEQGNKVRASVAFLPNSVGGVSRVKWWDVKQISQEQTRVIQDPTSKSRIYKSLRQLSQELNKNIEIGNPLASERQSGRFCGYVASRTGHLGVIETKETLFTFRCSELRAKVGDQIEVMSHRGLEYRVIDKSLGMER